MKVQDLMTSEVVTVHAEDDLACAVRRMKERDCGCIPVIDGEHRVIGLLTDRDICMAALRTGATLAEITAGRAMTSTVHCCKAADSIDAAQQVMGQHQVRRLPVTDENGRLLGILSLDDVALEARDEAGLIAPPVSSEAVGRTLGDIVRPHLVDELGI